MVAKVKDILPIIQYTASAGQTVFPYPFPVFASGDIAVTVDSVAKSEGTDYTVSGVDAEDGGDITFTSGLSAGDIVTIYRDMSFDRLTDYQQNGDFLSETINEDFDRVVLMVQQLNEVDARSLKFAPEDTGKTSVIDTSQKSKLLGLDENGSLFYYSASSDVETDYKTYSDLSSVIADTDLVLNDRGRIQGIGDFEIVSTNESGNLSALTSGNGFIKFTSENSNLSFFQTSSWAIIEDGLDLSTVVGVVTPDRGFRFILPNGTTGVCDGTFSISGGSNQVTINLSGGGSVLGVGAAAVTKAASIRTPISAPTDHILFQSNYGPFRAHMEPDRPIENGTVSKLDWMLDPYDGGPQVPYPNSSVDYRIFNIFTKTGDDSGLNGENGAAIIGTKNRADGNTWGVMSSVHFGFTDGANTAAKMYYFDTTDTEWRTPQKNFWYEGKPVETGDYVLYNGILYQSGTTGDCGSTPPTHTSGTASDGTIDWTFVRDYKLHTLSFRPVWFFGDRDDMPAFGWGTCGVQRKTDELVFNGNLTRYQSTTNTQAAAIGILASENTYGFHFSGGTGAYIDGSGIRPKPASGGAYLLGNSTDKFSRIYLSDGVYVGATKVVGSQQSAIADSAGGDEQAKINAILAALRAHGLIDT